jgi:hypothetical protein
MVLSSDLLTVATVSHVPQALVTLNSARRFAASAGYHMFVPDATADTIDKLPAILGSSGLGINFFGPRDLGVERDAFLSSFTYYNSFEISCLAKYVGLAHVLRTRAVETCAYADADILVLQDFREAISEIDDGLVLATPHQIGISSDEKEHEFLLYGWLNAGFFSVRRGPRTYQVLDWLIHRVSRRGFCAPHYGMSADQTWFSSLPFVFGDLTRISQNPGLNVGYWNLEQRQLTRTEGEFHVNGRPLVVFHFSGFDPAEPSKLSKYLDLKVKPGSYLDDLCSVYRGELKTFAPLRAKLKEVTKLSCSRATLNDRMLKGCIQNDLSLVNPSVKAGLFSRIGRRADLMLGRANGSLRPQK